MEAKDNDPAATPDQPEDTPKEKEVINWSQSVKDSKWASAEPTPSSDSMRPKQDSNSLASQWANAGNSHYSQGQGKRYKGYGNSDNYRKDYSYNRRTGDNGPNNGREYRLHDRSQQQSNYNRSRYDNRGYEQRQYDNRHESRLQHRFGHQHERQTFSPNSDSRWSSGNVSYDSRNEDLGKTGSQINGNSALDERPWNKRFLVEPDDLSDSSKDASQNGTAAASHSITISDPIVRQTEVDTIKVDESTKVGAPQELEDVHESELPATINVALDLKKKHGNADDSSKSVTESKEPRNETEEQSHSGDKSLRTDPEQPSTTQRRLSIDIGYWGRPPTATSEDSDIQDRRPKKSSGSNDQPSLAINKNSKEVLGSSASIYATKGNGYSPKADRQPDGHTKKSHGPSSIHEGHNALTESPRQHNAARKESSNTRIVHNGHSKSEHTEDRTATGGYVKHNIDEVALNARIERIRLQNEKIQQRKKLVEEEEKEIARQLQLEKEEREKRRLEDNRLEEEARLAAEKAKLERIEREKRMAEEIRAEREANAARKAKALASRDWDAEKGEDDLYIKDGRNRGDFMNRDRSTRLQHSFNSRHHNEDRKKKKESNEKSITTSEEKWPDLAGASADNTSATPAVWPAREAAEAKAKQKQEDTKESPVNSTIQSIASSPKLVSLKAARKTDIDNAHNGNHKDSLSWEEMIAKQKPVTDWATDSPTNEDINFEDSPFS